MSNNLFPDIAPRTTTALALIIVLLSTFFCAPHLLSILLAVALCIMLTHEWPRLNCYWLAPLYPTLPMALLIALNESPERRLLLFIFTFSTLFDSAGYFVGSAWGRHKIAPHLSAGKSWEGLVAGYSILFMTYPLLASLLHLQGLGWWTVPFIIAYGALAVGGDFFVSYLKRRVGIKHSSELLPGHGGILDRFASYLFTVVLIYTLRHWLT